MWITCVVLRFGFFKNIDFQHNNYVLKKCGLFDSSLFKHFSQKSKVTSQLSCCSPLRLYHESSHAIMPLCKGFVVQVGRCGSFKSVLHSCNHCKLKYRLKKDEKTKNFIGVKQWGKIPKQQGQRLKHVELRGTAKPQDNSLWVL